jgi:hypothetical protein
MKANLSARAVRASGSGREVGMDKLMWGYDYPRTYHAITYRQSSTGW